MTLLCPVARCKVPHVISRHCHCWGWVQGTRQQWTDTQRTLFLSVGPRHPNAHCELHSWLFHVQVSLARDDLLLMDRHHPGAFIVYAQLVSTARLVMATQFIGREIGFGSYGGDKL